MAIIVRDTFKPSNKHWTSNKEIKLYKPDRYDKAISYAYFKKNGPIDVVPSVRGCNRKVIKEANEYYNLMKHKHINAGYFLPSIAPQKRGIVHAIKSFFASLVGKNI